MQQMMQYWRGFSGAFVLLVLFISAVVWPLPPASTPPTDEERADILEKSRETAQLWLNQRQKNLDALAPQAVQFIEGRETGMALVKRMQDYRFETVVIYKNQHPVLWTDEAPALESQDSVAGFHVKNGRVMAVLEAGLELDSTKSEDDFRLIAYSGVQYMPGISSKSDMESLEAVLKRKEIAVSLNPERVTTGFSTNVEPFLQFDTGLWTRFSNYKTLRLKASLLIIWLATVWILFVFHLKDLGAGARTAVATVISLLVLLWLWSGHGFESVPAFVPLRPSRLPLLKYGLTNLILALSLSALTVYLLRLKRLYGVVWYPRTIFFSFTYGLVSGLLWFWILPQWMVFPLEMGEISPFEVSLLNNAATFIYFVSTELLFLPVIVFLTVLAWFLFGTERDQITWVSPLMIAGYALIAAAYLKLTVGPADRWALIASIGAFLGTKQLAYQIYKKPRQFAFISRIRLIALACGLTVLWTYWFVYSGYRVEYQLRAARAAGKILEDDRTAAEQLAKVLPRYVLRKSDFQTLFNADTLVQEALENQHTDRISRFDAALYRVEDGRIRAGLFSNVRFRLPEGVLEQAQLALAQWKPAQDIATLRLDMVAPVTIGFSPAGTLNDKNGVLLVVRPRYRQTDGSFDIVFEADAFPELEAFTAAFYRKGILVHRFFHGVTEPSFNPDPMLPEPEAESRLLPEFARDGFRSLLVEVNDDETLLIGYRDLGFSDHVFSAVRFFLSLVVFTMALYSVLLLAARRFPELITSRQRLQYRILDSYILSTLVFLAALVVATHITVRRQADHDFLTAFEQKLEQYRQELNQTDHKTWLDSQYKGDYILFEGPRLVQASRMKLMETGLLPETMPYGLYKELTEELQPRMIKPFKAGTALFRAGFLRLNRAENAEPLLLAFPAISNPAAEADYLFRTTSFLIIIYVSLFGLFIAGAALIARHISRPLADLSSGLRKVSTGEFSASVAVSSQDEVGDLANAYNLMIYKLQDLQKELAEAERQAALSEMARQVAHEIKNPLTPMKLSIQFLQRQVMRREQPIEELQAAVDRICTTVIEQIDSLNAIASDFSRFARPLTGVFKKTDINKIASDIIDLYRHDRRITIVQDLNENPLFVNAIGEELKRVLINLLKNSDEAMPEGGVLIIRTYPYKKQVFIEVVDNGAGIPVEMQSRIFTPNFSTKTSGTGLGLAICKKIVEGHGGEIGFASVPGAGTTFTLVFNAWEETQAENTTVAGPEKAFS